jgi:polyhydroxybutyrate depolymerase
MMLRGLRRRVIPAAAAAVLMAATCTDAGRGTGILERREVQVGDTVRSYALYLPPPKVVRPAALLLAFHGTGESGREMHRSAGLAVHADRDGFLIAYPDAAVGNWAEGCDCTRADELGVNDTGFVRAIIEDVAVRHPVDRARVAAVGFSQGGLFVHRLACEMADMLTAVASIAAPISTPLAQRCRPSRPVSVLVAMGTLDDAYPYEGRAAGIRSTLGARSTVAFWRTLNGCRSRTGSVRPGPGAHVIEERWSACDAGVTVALLTVEAGRHAWRVAEEFDAAGPVAALLRGTAGR